MTFYVAVDKYGKAYWSDIPCTASYRREVKLMENGTVLYR